MVDHDRDGTVARPGLKILRASIRPRDFTPGHRRSPARNRKARRGKMERVFSMARFFRVGPKLGEFWFAVQSEIFGAIPGPFRSILAPSRREMGPILPDLAVFDGHFGQLCHAKY